MLKYFTAYADDVKGQVRQLITQGRLAEMLSQKCPAAHGVKTDRAQSGYRSLTMETSNVSETIYEIPLRRIDGAETTLGAYRGKVVLIVNVASACGLTPQYAGLEILYQEKANEGLVIAGFPANEFGAQEPGSNSEIAQFCTAKFGVTFPLFEKIVVKGAGQHPLYRALIAAQPRAQEKPGSARRAKLLAHGIRQENAADILWNFEKFLLSRTGEVVGRFEPDIGPDDPLLRMTIEKELASL